MAAFVWALMMLIWLAGLVFGAWWVWPHFERLGFTGELVMSVFWLVNCASAWLLAFHLGRQRYWRR